MREEMHGEDGDDDPGTRGGDARGLDGAHGVCAAGCGRVLAAGFRVGGGCELKDEGKESDKG